MQVGMISFGLWLVKQEWFQFAVVKFITARIESSENTIDDKLLSFILRNKRSITSIINKEIKAGSEVADSRLVDAIKSVK